MAWRWWAGLAGPRCRTPRSGHATAPGVADLARRVRGSRSEGIRCRMDTVALGHASVATRASGNDRRRTLSAMAPIAGRDRGPSRGGLPGVSVAPTTGSSPRRAGPIRARTERQVAGTRSPHRLEGIRARHAHEPQRKTNQVKSESGSRRCENSPVGAGPAGRLVLGVVSIVNDGATGPGRSWPSMTDWIAITGYGER